MPARRLWTTAVATITLSVHTPVPAGAESLPPLKPWVVDYGETQCLALREYGKSEDPLTLAIRPAPNGETYELMLARKRGGPAFAEELQGTVAFGQGTPIKAWLLHYGARGDKVELYTFRINASDMMRARTADSVTLRSGSRPNVTFSLSNMPALLEGLQECTADLMRYWNMAGNEIGAIAVPGKGDLRKIFTSDDYPNEAIRRTQEGAAQFLLLIDEKGKVAGCHVAKASGIPALDGMGCQVIRERAKFTPALDHQGKPVRSSIVTPRVVWFFR